MGLNLRNFVKIAKTKLEMISVFLLFKYSSKFDHQTFLWKVKIKHENYFISYQYGIYCDTFSNAMLYCLFHVKLSYCVRQGS